MPKSLFSPKDAATVVGLSYRQLQYWDRTDFIKPSHHTEGKVRRYTFYDMLLLWIVNCLRDHEFSIQHLREVIKDIRRSLPKMNCPIEETTFWFLDSRIFILHGDAMVIPPGDMISIKAKDIADVITKLFPEKSSLPSPK